MTSSQKQNYQVLKCNLLILSYYENLVFFVFRHVQPIFF
jgi:hypothetical protein